MVLSYKDYSNKIMQCHNFLVTVAFQSHIVLGTIRREFGEIVHLL